MKQAQVAGYVAEAFYLIEIEEGAEEPRDGAVLGDGSRVFAIFGGHGQQGVHAAQVCPGPTAARGGNRAFVASDHLVGEVVLDELVALFLERFFGQQVVIERVAEQFERRGILEIVVLRNFVQRLLVQPVFACGQTGCQGKGQYD